MKPNSNNSKKSTLTRFGFINELLQNFGSLAILLSLFIEKITDKDLTPQIGQAQDDQTQDDLEPDYYYDKSERNDSFPDKVRIDEHTMRPIPLGLYIGRVNPLTREWLANDDILCKKFSEKQKEYLKIAYRHHKRVRVIGAAKTESHCKRLLIANSRSLITDTGFEIEKHERKNHDKPFNNKRAWMMWTRSNKTPKGIQKDFLNDPDVELWVLVFPSPQYVDQIAELIQAIYDDFKKVGLAGKGLVSVWHFNRLEREVAKWTGLQYFISLYIRHGDVVVIGNVELLLNGITSIGYKQKFQEWKRFGLDDMFGIQILVSKSNKRIVFLGVNECFWGEASAFYVECLLKAGARHILYGSKAASMHKVTDIFSIKSPNAFSVYSKHTNNPCFENIDSTLAADPALTLLATQSGIKIALGHATVPTVLGEDETQRQKLANTLELSTMDNEDGYIARIVKKHNELFNSLEPERVSFLPIHFISDYIHKPGESVTENQPGLAETQIKERNEGFTRIGQFFGIYASFFGLVEYVTIQTQIIRNFHAETNFNDILNLIRTCIDRGMISQAIESISNPDLPIPISNLLAITLLCQKNGYIDDALKAIDSIKSDSLWNKLSLKAKILISIIEIRIYTQVGNFLKAEEGINIVWREFGVSKNIILHEHYNSLLRRQALIIAQKNLTLSSEEERTKNWEDAVKYFKKSTKNVHQGSDLKHETATYLLYYSIAALAIDVAEVKSYKENLSEARALYLMSPRQSGPWMTNPEKSAANTLFVEAAYYLMNFGHNDARGLIRLGMAHLWNTRIGGTERSEGYGELINFIPDEVLKDLFRRAMRIDSIGQKVFEQFLKSKFLWNEIQKILEIFSLPIESYAEKLNSILLEIDQNRVK